MKGFLAVWSSTTEERSFEEFEFLFLCQKISFWELMCLLNNPWNICSVIVEKIL